MFFAQAAHLTQLFFAQAAHLNPMFFAQAAHHRRMWVRSNNVTRCQLKTE